jgi:hypothetical protein
MLTALDAPIDKLDDQEANFVDQIRKHGWFRSNIFGDVSGPGFSYTTGFWSGATAPEVIVFSLKSEIAHDVLWDIYIDRFRKHRVCLSSRSEGVLSCIPRLEPLVLRWRRLALPPAHLAGSQRDVSVGGRLWREVRKQPAQFERLGLATDLAPLTTPNRRSQRPLHVRCSECLVVANMPMTGFDP